MSYLPDFGFFSQPTPQPVAEAAPQPPAFNDNDSSYDPDLDAPGEEQDEPVQEVNDNQPEKPKRRYIPRKRDTGPLRQLQDGDVNLDNLWDETPLLERDHMPPPEQVYKNVDEAVNAVQAWAKDHGLAYSKQKWSRGRRTRLYMACIRSGGYRDTHKVGEQRKRKGKSNKINCPMGFFIVAVDNLDPVNSEWRVKWCQNRKSIVHNHPPEKDSYSLAVHRRATRTDEMRDKLGQIWPLAKGSREAHQLVKIMFPESEWTYQDVRNEYQQYLRKKQAAEKPAEKPVG